MPRRVKETNAPTGWPATAASREVAFVLHSHEANEVYLCGDFNHWTPHSLPMVRHGEDHCWEKRLALEPGRYEYKFIVNGVWIHNPDAPENVPKYSWLPQFRRGGPAMKARFNHVQRRACRQSPLRRPHDGRSKAQQQTGCEGVVQLIYAHFPPAAVLAAEKHLRAQTNIGHGGSLWSQGLR